LLVTCDRSVVFSRYWNILDSSFNTTGNVIICHILVLPDVNSTSCFRIVQMICDDIRNISRTFSDTWCQRSRRPSLFTSTIYNNFTVNHFRKDKDMTYNNVTSSVETGVRSQQGYVAVNNNSSNRDILPYSNVQQKYGNQWERL
jgi:hypothetical protein